VTGNRYPQKLWITLWTSTSKGSRFPQNIAYLLTWRKN